MNPWLKLIENITLAKLMSFLEFYGLLAGSRLGMGVNPWLKLIENITLAKLMTQTDTDIFNDVIQQDGRLHTAIQQLRSLTKCFVILRYLRCFSKSIKELAQLLLFYHSELTFIIQNLKAYHFSIFF